MVAPIAAAFIGIGKAAGAGAGKIGGMIGGAVQGDAMSGLFSHLKMLIKVVSTIAKLISLIVRPIINILALGLLPLMYMLKPIARIMNILFRPYLQKAMQAFAAGGKALSQGDTESAGKLFALGQAFLLQPILDVLLLVGQAIVQGITFAFFEAIKLVVAAIGIMAVSIASIFDAIFGTAFAPIVADMFAGLLTGITDVEVDVIEAEGKFFTDFKTDITDGLDGALAAIKEKLTGEDGLEKVAKTTATLGINPLTSSITELAKASTKAYEDIMANLANSNTATQGTDWSKVLGAGWEGMQQGMFAGPGGAIVGGYAAASTEYTKQQKEIEAIRTQMQKPMSATMDLKFKWNGKTITSNDDISKMLAGEGTGRNSYR